MYNGEQLKYDGKVIFFTSFYKQTGYAPYIRDIVTTVGALDKLGVKWDYWPRSGDFHIDRAVNDTLTKFMNDPDATDLIMIDSDESWEVEGIVRLLYHPEEIVSAAYRMTNNWKQYLGALKYEDGEPVGKMLPDGTALLEAERVPGGFLRIKKSALKRFHDAYPELRCREPDGEMTIFFERFMIDGVMCSQDYGFSHRWTQIGGQLWIDPMIKVGHWGITEYPGDFDKFLRSQREILQTKIDIPAAFAAVQEMAKALESSRT